MRTKIRGMPKLIALSAMLITTAVTTLYKPMETYAYDSAWGYTADSHTATAQVKLTYKDGYCSGYTNENKRGGIPNANEYYLTKLQAHVKTNDGQYLGHIVYGAHYHNTGWTNYLRQDEQDLTENDDRWIEALTFYLDPQEGVGADRQISNFYYVKYSTWVQPVTEPYYHDHTNASDAEETATWNRGLAVCDGSEANQTEKKQDGGENATSYFPDKWDPRNWSGTAGKGLPIVGAKISLERYPCKVTVKPNGGSWNGSTSDSSATFSAGDSLNLANPTREGYTFTGWTIGSDGGYPTESAYNCYQVPDDGIAPTVDGSSVYCGNADHFSVVANWKKNTYKQIVKVRYQNADGTWGSYSDVINADYAYGSTVSWSREEDAKYEAKSVSYTVSEAKTTKLDIHRKQYKQVVKVRYQNADGTWGSYSDVINADYTYGSTVSWSREEDSKYKAASVSYTVTEAKTSYVDVYRQQYKQIVKVRYQNADGTWGSYSDVINANYYYGATVSWSRAEDAKYEAKSVSYTVSGEKTTKLDVKRRSYNQTINYYYYKASGTYNSPTHTKTLLGSKSWSQLYETTFNAKDHKADWGNVDGYHWSSIDSESWTVKGTASTNSYYSANVYRLSVDKKDGSDVATYDMEYGTNIDLGTPTRTGWAFKGWKITTNNSTNSSLSSNTFTMGYNNSYKYQTYVAVPTVKIIANWEDVTAPAGNDTILKATNPTKTTTYASVTASTPKADTPWVNNNVLLTFTSKDNESGLSGLGIYEKITSGWKAVSSKTLSGVTTAQSITYTDSKEGSYVYYGKATDNASATHGSPANKTTSTAELTVHIDKTAPVYKEELLTTGIKHGSLPHGMTTGGVVVDTETGDVNISELSSKITVEVSDENSTLADSTDVSGIKKVTLVVYDSDYVTDSDVYTNIYKAGTGKDALTSALKYKEYDMTAESDSIEKNGAGAIYEAVYAVTTNLYEDFKTSASLKYFMVAVDNAGNENKVYSAENEAISNISIFAYITRNAKDLDDGSDNFLCGDGGTLHVVTYGYIDELDIDFPSKLLKAALLDAERMQGEHSLGTTQKDNAEYVEGAFLDPTITLAGGCQRNYDYPFIVPLYLGDESIEFLTKAPTWTDENPVYDMTEILTYETGYKHTNTMSGTATATAQAKAKCYVGTHDDGATKMTDRFHTHIIAPD